MPLALDWPVAWSVALPLNWPVCVVCGASELAGGLVCAGFELAGGPVCGDPSSQYSEQNELFPIPSVHPRTKKSTDHNNPDSTCLERPSL